MKTYRLLMKDRPALDIEADEYHFDAGCWVKLFVTTNDARREVAYFDSGVVQAVIDITEGKAKS